MHDSILHTLHDEHEQLFLLLEQIELSPNLGQRLHLFDEMKKELVPHLRGEELTIYEKLRHEIGDEKAMKLSRTSDIEHHHIRDYLQKLNLLVPESDAWLDTFKEFRRFTEKHCRDEESELFPFAKEDFSEVELEEIAYEFEEAKHH